MIIDTLFQSFTLLLLVSVLSEAMTEILKTAVNGVINGKTSYIVSIVIGIILAYAFNLNIFGLEGYALHISIISAGIISSRGANYVHGLMKQIGAIQSLNNDKQ